MRVLTDPGVSQPRSDTRLLVGAISGPGLSTGAKVLDLCIESGVGTAATLRGASVTAVDGSRRARAALERICAPVHRLLASSTRATVRLGTGTKRR